MASSHSSPHSEVAKLEQIITEFYAKSLHIILESRTSCMSSRNFSGEQVLSSPSSSSSSSSSVRPRDKWFNLALRECPAALENLDLWRQSSLEPMVVDVILVQRPLDWDPVNFSPKRGLTGNFSLKERYPFCWGSDQDDIGCEARGGKVIERWLLQYESRRSRDSGTGSRRSSSTLHVVYKKSVLLLRSLYTMLRLLPAYKIFRDINSSGQICAFTLGHRVSSFSEPFTRKEDAEMQQFSFTPVDTSCGRLCLSVVYRSSISDVNSEPSTPMSPQFIPDYVGSPLTDPMKRVQCNPMTHGSPSSLPFSRRHSWSYDRYKASPSSISFSPSPTHSEPHVSSSNPSSQRFVPMNLPPLPPETSSIHKKNISFDEYSTSPNFTPSPSPSPSSPISIPGHLSKAILRSESAPVRIPASKLATSPLLFNKNNLPPSPPLRGTGSGNPRNEKSTTLIQTGNAAEKLVSLGKDDLKRFSGVKTTSLPRISFSRSPSRSFQDDYDFSEFPCPFDVEDDDVTDPGSRPESLESGGLFPVRKSQDAAVGTLVDMLNKAPPLRQDFSTSIDLPQESRSKMWGRNIEDQNQISAMAMPMVQPSSSVASSRFVPLKTTADALEELRGYKEMKDMLLGQVGRSPMHNPSNA